MKPTFNSTTYFISLHKFIRLLSTYFLHIGSITFDLSSIIYPLVPEILSKKERGVQQEDTVSRKGNQIDCRDNDDLEMKISFEITDMALFSTMTRFEKIGSIISGKSVV